MRKRSGCGGRPGEQKARGKSTYGRSASPGRRRRRTGRLRAVRRLRRRLGTRPKGPLLFILHLALSVALRLKSHTLLGRPSLCKPAGDSGPRSPRPIPCSRPGKSQRAPDSPETLPWPLVLFPAAVPGVMPGPNLVPPRTSAAAPPGPSPPPFLLPPSGPPPTTTRARQPQSRGGPCPHQRPPPIQVSPPLTQWKGRIRRD